MKKLPRFYSDKPFLGPLTRGSEICVQARQDSVLGCLLRKLTRRHLRWVKLHLAEAWLWAGTGWPYLVRGPCRGNWGMEAASARAEAAGRILDEAPHDGRTRDHERKRRLAAAAGRRWRRQKAHFGKESHLRKFKKNLSHFFLFLSKGCVPQHQKLTAKFGWIWKLLMPFTSGIVQ